MKAIKHAAVVTIGLLATSSVWAASADPGNAKALLDEVEKNLHSTDEVANLKMKIVEPDGTAKERALEIRRKGSEEKQKVLVRMQEPADLRGTALLSVNKGKESDQWLYLPSSKQTRRILSNKRSSSFMDSELSYEDMGTNSNFESKVIRQENKNGQNYSVIESTPKGESAYGKIHIWVNLATRLVDKMEYFDKTQKPLKVTEFSNYKKNDKGIWRAGTVNVKNVQTQRGTVLTLSGLRVNQGLADSEFTESALTDGE